MCIRVCQSRPLAWRYDTLVQSTLCITHLALLEFSAVSQLLSPLLIPLDHRLGKTARSPSHLAWLLFTKHDSLRSTRTARHVHRFRPGGLMAIDMLGKRDENLNTSASCCFDRWLDSTLATFNAVAFVVALTRTE